jgi:hypothetical protein
MANQREVELLFVGGLSERVAAEAQARGYLSHVIAKIEGMGLFALFFWDPTRLKQDLDTEPYIADPGMIVISEVTKDKMEKAVRDLANTSFFERLVPLTPEEFENANTFGWPPSPRKTNDK